MKKYSFPLDNVLNFREQVLENLKSEHAQILMQIAEREKVIRQLKDTSEETNHWLNDRMGTTPMSIGELQEYRRYLDHLQQKIQAEQEKLALLRQKEEAKRDEVVAAKKDKASIERLKEKSREEYQHAYQKDEEQQIEEFVSNKRLLQGASTGTL